MKNCISWILLISISMLGSSQHSATDQRPFTVNKYIKKFHYLAIELNKETNIPVPIIIAIAGLESNWGKSELTINANNHFGIKNKE